MDFTVNGQIRKNEKFNLIIYFIIILTKNAYMSERFMRMWKLVKCSRELCNLSDYQYLFDNYLTFLHHLVLPKYTRIK